MMESLSCQIFTYFSLSLSLSLSVCLSISVSLLSLCISLFLPLSLPLSGVALKVVQMLPLFEHLVTPLVHAVTMIANTFGVKTIVTDIVR